MESQTAPLNIAILGSRGFPSTYGGYETLVRHLAVDWARRGHAVTVYCRKREARGLRRTWSDGEVRCVWTPGLDSKSLSTLSFGATAHLDAAARRFDAALVLNIANGFYLPLLRSRRIPAVVNTDGLEWERGKWGAAARRVFFEAARCSARFADSLVADSEAMARIWERTFGVRPAFIPYGAPVVSGAGSAKLAGLGLRPREYVLAVARLTPENNVELTLDALDLTAGSPRAVVVGSANYDSPLAARLSELQDRGRVLWLGHVSDQELLTQLWAHCGAYVHGHSVGGTNPALLQALGAGAPTLALDTEFNREVVGAGEQLFAPDPRDLAQRLERLLSSAQAQDRFAAAGKAVVAERYSWDDVCDAYLDALADARHRRGQGRSPRRPRRGS